MKERPILFSAPMVRAILEGRKTQTRRILKKNAPVQIDNYFQWRPSGKNDFEALSDTPSFNVPSGWAAEWCPYGMPSDRLWVRETFSVSGLTKYHDTGNPNDHGGPNDPCCAFAATGTYRCGKRIPDAALATGSHKWKPSIFLPRKLSRITLEITEVRVQRLQEIADTEDGSDYAAEGITPWEGCDDLGEAYKAAFVELWNQINGKRAPWDSNSWVWAITFKRLAI